MRKEIFFSIFIVPILMSLTVGYTTLRQANRLGGFKALGATLLLLLMGIAVLIFPRPGESLRHWDDGWVFQTPASLNGGQPLHNTPFEVIVPLWRIMVGGTLPLFAISFFAMLLQKWLGVTITPEEEQSGKRGLRAWLTTGRLIWIAWIALGLYSWLEVPLLLSLPLLVASLLIYPVSHWLSMESAPGTSTAVAAQAMNPEKEKVLELVAEKRISAEEGAELLNALSLLPGRDGQPPQSLSRERKMVLAGAVLVVLGFFLPWFAINPVKEVTAMLSQSDGMSSTHQNPGVYDQAKNVLSAVGAKDGIIHIRGGDIQNGLGWLILITVVLAAVVPFLTRELDARTRKLVEIGAVAVAGFLLLYLAGSNYRFVTFGFAIVIIGYALELAGTVRTAQMAHSPYAES